jgi:GTPase SAR1 family protein
MFDLTNRASFTVLREHIIDVTRGQYRYLSCVLIGNKSDDVEHRQVLLPEISEFAGMYNIDYFETSAKLYTNIDEAFITLGRNSLRQYGVLTEKKKESTVSSWCAVS